MRSSVVCTHNKHSVNTSRCYSNLTQDLLGMPWSLGAICYWVGELFIRFFSYSFSFPFTNRQQKTAEAEEGTVQIQEGGW